MTGASTVPQFADRIICTGFLVFPVLIFPVIAGMATGTIGLVCSISPGCGLGVTGMAIQARHTRVVVAGIVACRVRERNVQPGSCVVAVVALQGRHEMRGRLAGRRCAVVAGRARAGYRSVIEAGWYPCDRRMANVAFGRCLHVSGGLARGGYAVVAARARCGYARMIEYGRYPAYRCVAVVAVIGACYVGCGLADGCRAVVATVAGAADCCMIDLHHRRPRSGVVAVFAGVRSGYMRCRLAGRCRAIMASRAGCGYARMVENRRSPSGRRMTIVACITTGNVGGGLSGGGSAIVATVTCA